MKSKLYVGKGKTNIISTRDQNPTQKRENKMPSERTLARKAKTREANRNLFTKTQGTTGFELTLKRDSPVSINAILNHVAEAVNHKLPKSLVGNHPPAETAILYRQLQIAVRDNHEAPTFRCNDPLCRHEFQLPILACCPGCGSNVEYKVPHLAMETNGIKAAHKLLDKLFPNLQQTDHSINFEGAIISISGEIARIIVQYVDPKQRKQCLDEIDELMQKVQGSLEATGQS